MTWEISPLFFFLLINNSVRISFIFFIRCSLILFNIIFLFYFYFFYFLTILHSILIFIFIFPLLLIFTVSIIPHKKTPYKNTFHKNSISPHSLLFTQKRHHSTSGRDIYQQRVDLFLKTKNLQILESYNFLSPNDLEAIQKYNWTSPKALSFFEANFPLDKQIYSEKHDVWGKLLSILKLTQEQQDIWIEKFINMLIKKRLYRAGINFLDLPVNIELNPLDATLGHYDSLKNKNHNVEILIFISDFIQNIYTSNKSAYKLLRTKSSFILGLYGILAAHGIFDKRIYLNYLYICALQLPGFSPMIKDFVSFNLSLDYIHREANPSYELFFNLCDSLTKFCGNMRWAQLFYALSKYSIYGNPEFKIPYKFTFLCSITNIDEFLFPDLKKFATMNNNILTIKTDDLLHYLASLELTNFRSFLGTSRYSKRYLDVFLKRRKNSEHKAYVVTKTHFSGNIIVDITMLIRTIPNKIRYLLSVLIFSNAIKNQCVTCISILNKDNWIFLELLLPSATKTNNPAIGFSYFKHPFDQFLSFLDNINTLLNLIDHDELSLNIMQINWPGIQRYLSIAKLDIATICLLTSANNDLSYFEVFNLLSINGHDELREFLLRTNGICSFASFQHYYSFLFSLLHFYSYQQPSNYKDFLQILNASNFHSFYKNILTFSGIVKGEVRKVESFYFLEQLEFYHTDYEFVAYSTFALSVQSDLEPMTTNPRGLSANRLRDLRAIFFSTFLFAPFLITWIHTSRTLSIKTPVTFLPNTYNDYQNNSFEFGIPFEFFKEKKLRDISNDFCINGLFTDFLSYSDSSLAKNILYLVNSYFELSTFQYCPISRNRFDGVLALLFLECSISNANIKFRYKQNMLSSYQTPIFFEWIANLNNYHYFYCFHHINKALNRIKNDSSIKLYKDVEHRPLLHGFLYGQSKLLGNELLDNRLSVDYLFFTCKSTNRGILDVYYLDEHCRIVGRFQAEIVLFYLW